MNGQPVSFAVGSETLAWLRQGGQMNPVGCRISLLMRWQSFWFDRNRSLQRKLGPGPWQGDDPVFIMGLWRSGTTFMHELLAAYPGFIWPATWQCMNPSAFAMQSPPRESVSLARPMDDFTISTFSPQEDEFALLALGVPSVNRCYFDPGRLNDVSRWLEPDFWSGRSDGWVKIWREFLGCVTAGKTGRLLLKSPNHTFRIRGLMEEFPKASYIWLVRDPAETLFSNRKMWVAMFRRYALRDWDEYELEAFLTKAFQYAAESLSIATAVLGQDQLVVVDFEQFKRAPVETVKEIFSRLKLGDWATVADSILGSDAGRAKHEGDSYTGCQLGQKQIMAAENLNVSQKAALASHGL